MAFTDATSEPVLVPTLFLALDLEVLSQQKRESSPAAVNNETRFHRAVIAELLWFIDGNTSSLSLSKEWASKSGKYLSNCEQQGEFEKQGKPEGRDDGYKPWAYDEEGEGRLWKDSLKMVGLDGGE